MQLAGWESTWSNINQENIYHRSLILMKNCYIISFKLSSITAVQHFLSSLHEACWRWPKNLTTPTWAVGLSAADWFGGALRLLIDMHRRTGERPSRKNKLATMRRTSHLTLIPGVWRGITPKCWSADKEQTKPSSSSSSAYLVSYRTLTLRVRFPSAAA